MRWGRRFLVFVALAVCALCVAPAAASAHPLGNFTINRYTGIEVATDEIVVHYVVDMAEIPTIQELGIRSGQEVDQEALDAYAEDLVPRLADNLTLTANDDSVALRAGRPATALLPGEGPLEVLRLEVDFTGELADPGATIEYIDDNYADRVGWKEIVIYPVRGQGIERSSVPSESISDELRSYPQDELTSPLNQATASADLAPGAGEGVVPKVREETASFDVFGDSFASLIERDLTPGAFLLALVLAVGFGAVHALGPGHGKTVMAAYLVAEGRVRHAVSVGVAVSIMHTFSVVVLGLLTLWASSLFPPESVYPYLSLVSGVVVLALGTWLLRVRMHSRNARRTPIHRHASERVLVGVGANGNAHEHEHDRSRGHDHGGHSHDHLDDSGGHDHGFGYHTHSAAELPAGVAVLSRRGLVAIALSGGLLPSPSALVVLLGSIALGRVAFGLTLVAAFSVGLAGALTLVGIAVLRARAYATRRFGSRAGAVLPILSAAAITLLGAWLTLRALFALG